MTKNELIKNIGTKTGFTQKDISIVVDAMLSTIIESVASEDPVNLVGFGKFDISHRAARTGVNPATGESINIPATATPKFKAGTFFKQALKK